MGAATVVTLFLSTPSARRATIVPQGAFVGPRISIHALREEGDPFFWRFGAACRAYFYPRPPRGGRQAFLHEELELDLFLSTPSARRATGGIAVPSWCTMYFYPRPPRGGRPSELLQPQEFGQFLSTPSARRATGHQGYVGLPVRISIHALREEGDDDAVVHVHKVVLFLSTPSARRATSTTRPRARPRSYFYPRPPRGGRRLTLFACGLSTDFYPRPPRGGRLRVSRGAINKRRFLSTPSARRATAVPSGRL